MHHMTKGVEEVSRIFLGFKILKYIVYIYQMSNILFFIIYIHFLRIIHFP